MLEVLPHGVVLLHGDGRVSTFNESFARLVGCHVDELLGTHIHPFLDRAAIDLEEEIRDVECQLTTIECP
jgi:PAS domain-containing protein